MIDRRNIRNSDLSSYVNTVVYEGEVRMKV